MLCARYRKNGLSAKCDPFHSLCRVAAREQFLIGWMLHYLAAANERHGKAKLGALVKHLARLAFAAVLAHRCCRACRSDNRSRTQKVHGLHKIFEVTGQFIFPKWRWHIPSLNVAGMSFSGRPKGFADQRRMSSAHQSCATGTQVDPDGS